MYVRWVQENWNLFSPVSDHVKCNKAISGFIIYYSTSPEADMRSIQFWDGLFKKNYKLELSLLQKSLIHKLIYRFIF